MSKTLNVPEEDKKYLDLLTDEERAGMEEGEDFDESDGADDDEDDAAGNEGSKGATGAADDDAGKQDGENGDDDTAGTTTDDAAATAAAAAAAAAPADDGKGNDGAADTASAEDIAFASVPAVPVSKLPDDFGDKVKAVDSGKAELATKLNEGDIDMVEYHAELDKLNKQERELERTKDRVESNEQRRYETWTNIHVIGYMKQHSEYSNNEMLTGLLDQEVRKLQASGKFDSDTDPQILIEAHKKISTAFPGTFKEPDPKAKTGKTNEPGKPTPRNTAPSLAKVPASNVDEPGEGEFSSLDRLLETDSLAWERACERLSRSDPAKYEQYLAQ